MSLQNNKLTEILKSGDYSKTVLFNALNLVGEEQNDLFALSRECRHVGFPDDSVQVRSVIETSNVCRQGCRYCAIGGKNQKTNYTLDAKTTVNIMRHLCEKGRNTILLQSGETANRKFIDDMGKAISEIKAEFPKLNILLCMGNLGKEQYRFLHQCGADGYILKFESSNPELFAYCRPRDNFENRLRHIEMLCEEGFAVGSGNIVGLPGQTIDDLCDDLALIHKLPLAMNSTTIFCPAENSYFENCQAGNPNITLNFMALMRIMNPSRLMPTTSSLKKMIPDGQFLGLMAGANTVTIHDGTPEELQTNFPIYSSKRVRPQSDDFRDIIDRAKLNNTSTL